MLSLLLDATLLTAPIELLAFTARHHLRIILPILCDRYSSCKKISRTISLILDRKNGSIRAGKHGVIACPKGAITNVPARHHFLQLSGNLKELGHRKLNRCAHEEHDPNTKPHKSCGADRPSRYRRAVQLPTPSARSLGLQPLTIAATFAARFDRGDQTDRPHIEYANGHGLGGRMGWISPRG